MMKNGINSKVCLLVLMVISLLFVPSCKKSDDAEQPGDTQTQSDNSTEKTATPSQGKIVPLPLELPKPMFVGTPTNIQVENLEKPLGRVRDPFLAPAGAANVALGKAVSSSSDEPLYGDLEYITDGDKSAADGSNVELLPSQQGPTSVTIDLGARYEIYAVLFWHYHKQPRVYFDVVVQASDDPDFITATTLFNNDNDNSSGLGIGKDMNYVETNEGKLIDAKGVQAQYVRLYSNGNSSDILNHYIEVEVWGKPVQ